jgi:energy-coupling factor transporter ATP-binding protein EcfA2
LFRAGWNDDGGKVSEGALAKAVSDTNIAHGKEPVIENIPRMGYRFIGEIATNQPARPVTPDSNQSVNEKYQIWRDNADLIFAPGPIEDELRFVGREPELQTARNYLLVAGQHILLYGPTGAGKSSLANILAISLTREKSGVWCRVDVNEDDTFQQICRKVRSAVYEKIRQPTPVNENEPTPFELAAELHSVARLTRVIVVLDELQRRMAPQALVGIAELLRGLGNLSSRAQFIVAGVARNVADLMNGHESRRELRRLKSSDEVSGSSLATAGLVRRPLNNPMRFSTPLPRSRWDCQRS